jgi:hypothetical protein
MRAAIVVAAAFAAALSLGGAARAETPRDFAAQLAAEARRAQPGFAGFSAERGRRFYAARHGGEWSCATCHGADPRALGEHVVTGKRIQPLAPSANAARFTDPAKVAKWFRRNCRDVLDRECTALEKGDVLAWLTSLEK